jgi:hypothetical protein
VTTYSTQDFDLVTDNNHMVQFYDSSYYSYGDMVFGVSLIILGVMIVMLIISMVLYFTGRNGNSKLVWIAL